MGKMPQRDNRNADPDMTTNRNLDETGAEMDTPGEIIRSKKYLLIGIMIYDSLTIYYNL